MHNRLLSHGIIKFRGIASHQRSPQWGACLTDETRHAADWNWIVGHPEEFVKIASRTCSRKYDCGGCLLCASSAPMGAILAVGPRAASHPLEILRLSNAEFVRRYPDRKAAWEALKKAAAAKKAADAAAVKAADPGKSGKPRPPKSGDGDSDPSGSVTPAS